MNQSFCNLPISVKGIIFEEGKVWLRKNERQEWELPGGRLEKNEQPAETVIREIQEELGFEVEVMRPVHAEVYKTITSGQESGGVLILCYLCKLVKKTGAFELEGEAGPAEFLAFSLEEIQTLPLPTLYKTAISQALEKYDTV